MIDIRPVFFILGFVTLALGGVLLVNAAVSWFMDDRDWTAYLISSLGVCFIAGLAIMASRPDGAIRLTIHQMFLVTSMGWFWAAVVCALPLCFSTLDMNFTDAFFESASGLTTTGATVITGLDNAPKGVLLWRGLMHWIGGLGVPIMAIAVLPFLRVGGMQLFRMDTSDNTDKVRARVSQTTTGITIAYVVLSLICTMALWLVGMSVFEAIIHAMSALSTGGFSTSDSSVGYFKNAAVEWILIVFMFLGAMNFITFMMVWKNGTREFLKDTQTIWLIGIISFFSLSIALWVFNHTEMGWHDSLRHSTFTVVSVISTTGFATTDWNLWSGYPLLGVFVICFIGGCTGSTSGGIKVFRLQILFAAARMHIRKLLHPHGVFIFQFNNLEVSAPIVRSVASFVVLYLSLYGLMVVSLALCGIDMVTAITGAIACLGNIGPGLGEIIGPAGTFQSIPAAGKWILSVGMILGRMEILPAIVIFTTIFWRP